jgi:hypothetical protein
LPLDVSRRLCRSSASNSPFWSAWRRGRSINSVQIFSVPNFSIPPCQSRL